MDSETLEKVRLAFYKVFTGAGELWFPYNSSVYSSDKTTEELEKPVEEKWQEILDELNSK